MSSPKAALGAGAGDAPAAQRELQVGARDEAGGAFARALEHYRACVAAAPSSRYARGARGRIAWIEERSEGGFQPLAARVRLRRDGESLGDPAAVARLATETESFPAGLVRSEMRLRVAEAWLKVPGHREDASTELRRILFDPTSGDSDRRFAERDLVQSLLADGHLDAARDEVSAHPFDPQVAADVARLLHRRRTQRAATGALVALLSMGAVAVLWRRRGGGALCGPSLMNG